MAMLSDLYEELFDVVDLACSGGVQGRGNAQRYANCRQLLMQQMSRASLPGFLIQCVSIDRFVDFITLYHPDIEARRSFLVQQFSRVEPVRIATSVDIFDSPL